MTENKTTEKSIKEKRPLAVIRMDKGLSLFDFCNEHPYLTALFMCLLCLCIGQGYEYLNKTGNVMRGGVLGELIQLPKLYLCLIIVFAAVALFWGVQPMLKSLFAVERLASVGETAAIALSAVVFKLAAGFINAPLAFVLAGLLLCALIFVLNRKVCPRRRWLTVLLGGVLFIPVGIFINKAETVVSVYALLALMVLPIAFIAVSVFKNIESVGGIKVWYSGSTLSVRTVLAVLISLLAVFIFSVGEASFYCLAAVTALFLWLRHVDLPVIKQVLTVGTALASFFLARFLYGQASASADGVVLVALAIAAGGLAITAISGGVKVKHVVAAMFLVGFALRLGYVLDVPLPRNQHDVFSIGFNEAYPRHNSYIWHIFETGTLPADRVYNAGLSQYYHPPLHHALSALWMKLQVGIGIDAYAAYENVQYLTLFFSSVMIIAADKLFCEFKLKGALRVALTALIAFHPTFYILAGSINNDALATMLLFLVVLFAVRWHKSQSVYNTVCLGLTIGLAMMAKLSGAMVAVGVAYLMLAKLFDFRTGVVNNFKRLWQTFALFASVCFPLGLWWPIRGKLLYGMPLGFVPSMSVITNNNPANPVYNAQYTGFYGTAQRLFHIDGTDLHNPYPNIGLTDEAGLKAVYEADKYYDYSIGPYALKSSLFGEYFNKLNVNALQNVLCYVMLIAAAVLIVYSLVGMATCIYKSYCNDRNGGLRKNSFLANGEEQPFRLIVLYHLLLVGSYVVFCFKFPFTCTMDFRYIVPTLLTGALASGIFLRGDYRWKKGLRIGYIGITAVFCVASALFYFISYMVITT